MLRAPQRFASIYRQHSLSSRFHHPRFAHSGKKGVGGKDMFDSNKLKA